MSETLSLYKKLTFMGSTDLGEDSLKFSIILSKKYADMLNELTNRSGLARAQIARMLLCTALDEIDEAYNLQNLEDFDYRATIDAEEQLKQYEEYKVWREVEKRDSRCSELRFIRDHFVPETEEQQKVYDNALNELEELENTKEIKLENGVIKID